MLEKGSWCTTVTQTWTCHRYICQQFNFFASFFFRFQFDAHLGVRLALPPGSPQVPSCISGVCYREHHCGARRSPPSTSGSSLDFCTQILCARQTQVQTFGCLPRCPRLFRSLAPFLPPLLFLLFDRNSTPDHSLELFPRGPFQHSKFPTEQDGWRAHGRRPRGRREAAQVAGSLGAALLQQASSVPALQPLHTDADANCLRFSYNHHGERHSSFADVESEQVLANR